MRRRALHAPLPPTTADCYRLLPVFSVASLATKVNNMADDGGGLPEDCGDFASRRSYLELKYARVCATSKVLFRVNSHHDMDYCGYLPKQVDALNFAMAGHDVLVVVPTGYGKTLIFQSLPYLTEDTRCVVVASPLDAIIEEQAKKLGALVVDNTFVSMLDSGASIGRPTFLIGHPEMLTKPAVKEYLRTLDVGHLVIDEAHCVISWGQSNFRPAFLALQNLRCFLPNSRTMALTATASPRARVEILKELHMKSAKTVSLTPNRYSLKDNHNVVKFRA